ncbi:MAG: restriction endonuclease subunit S, partial [Candidatus Omnitrophica bacterium]|nr:restriction endonuclease subunit S [Candidatus Omnitrophota bacterium]
LSAAFSGELTKTWRLENKDLNAKDDLGLIGDFILKSEIANREKNTFKEINKISLDFYEEQFEVPSSWVACCVGFIGVVNNGSTPSRKIARYWNGSIPWISSGEVRNNKINVSREKITQEGLDNCSSKLFPAGTVLIAMIGEGKTRGQSAILNIDAAINQNIAAVQIAHGQINPEYLWYWFQYQYENNRSFGSGSGPQALNCQRVRELPFVLAPKAEQDQIVEKIKSSFRMLDGFIKRYLKSKNYTDKLEQSILAKAFRGELVT